MENGTEVMMSTVAAVAHNQSSASSSSDIAREVVEELTNGGLALVLVALLAAILWVLYITYYNSRVLGYVLTRLVNKFYFQDENFKLGSITLNALSGKIMFRDLVYINYDYTVRIQDGYLIFRWWRSYVPKDASEDLSHSDTRLSIMLNGFEVHLYNRCELYSALEKTFGLEPQMGAGDGAGTGARDGERAMNLANDRRGAGGAGGARPEAALARTWRDLIPVIKVDVCCARAVLGNRLVPTSLLVSAEEAHLVYSTKPPASSLDYLMHFVKAKADNCKVLLAPSPNYTAMVDEPPRYMGEGFVVMSSNYMELYFYMDEPGVVPERPVLLQLANGDVVEAAPPIWGVDVKCGKGTDFSYGPWADRQRDHLFRFFFPPDYSDLAVTPQPRPGDRRQMQSFDIRLSTLNEATVDILFTKNKETNAVHINIGAGSYLEVTLPWIVLQDGYTTRVTGQLLHLEATTSLQYRSLAESETLEYNIKCHYPLVWNHHQCWQLALTGCKASVNFVYTHIDFFQDLVNDWSSKARPDILHFVPYTWKISVLLKECEVITVSNQYNWIDCSSTNQENNHVAFSGDLLDVSFDLPFVDFLPDVIPLKIWVQGEAVDMSLYLPEVNTSRLLLLSIDKNMKLIPCRLKASKWRRKCVKSQGWVDCWSVPIVALSVRYAYHPAPPTGPEPQADITTPEKEEILLSPMRIPRFRKQPQISWPVDGHAFDRTALPPDKVNVELEVGPSVLLAYGTIITGFMNLLENIFGEDQTFTDMQKSPNMEGYLWSSEKESKEGQQGGAVGSASQDDSSEGGKVALEPWRWRPLEVTVSIIIHDIQAHLVKNCSESDPPCPVVLIERFGFEMNKTFRETKLQLLLSPSILVSANNLSRTNPTNSGVLYQGHLMLSSLQLRGNGFFSDANRNVDEDTIEYAWMMEIQLGQLTGRMTLPQLYQVVTSLEMFVLLICDSENELTPPNPIKQCHHGVNQFLCSESDLTSKYRCPTPNEIKYRMVRVAIDLIDIYLAESSTTLQTRVAPVRLSFCNLHGPGFASGVTALLPTIKLALYTQTNMQANPHHNSNGSNTSQHKVPDNDNWVGVGSVSLGPVLVEAASALPQSPKNLHLVQQKFLRVHDEKTKRLWFMWPAEGKGAACGCVGGCAFFGSNRNGPSFLKPSPSELQENVNVAAFHVAEGGEFGYGQSVLHAGQLVFHTAPYAGRRVVLAPPPAAAAAPPPSPQPAPRPLARRASYATSAQLLLARGDVPYARLVDAPPATPPAVSKIDSDSKLNRAVLSVPQMESSASDSRLALSCAAKEGAVRRPTAAADPPLAPLPPSESHYSLQSQPPPDDTASPEVRRTTSITSENQSEAFFSADEDMFPSRSSSLKHSFGSRHSNPRDKSSFATGEVGERFLSRVPAPDAVSTSSAPAQPDSESGSVSSTSFVSAISSQEDMTLVNLHMQTNKPIVDSPLLMASYMNTLTQYRCPNWGSCSLPAGTDLYTLPLFRREEDGTLVYVGQKYLPAFEPIGKVNVFKLLSKKDNNHGPYSNLAPNFNSQIKAHPFPLAFWEVPENAQENQEKASEKPATPTASTSSDSRDGVSVRVRGEVDVLLTPLVLESAQRFVEALTPALGAAHPATVLARLRLRCVAAVQRANVLKQRHHVLNWQPQLEARARSLGATGVTTTAALPRRCSLATIAGGAAAGGDLYEESVCSQLHAALAVPRVNVVLVQSSVIEDMISFSALDNLQDLTCVSLCAVALEGVAARWAAARRRLESLALCARPPLRPKGKKAATGIIKGGRALLAAAAAAPDRADRPEPVYIEATQQRTDDSTFTLNFGKVHLQLRRVRNEASQLKDATITGIPPHHSKVAFRLARLDTSPIATTNNNTNAAAAADSAPTAGEESAVGYIMVECGVEGVAVRVAQHAQEHKPAGEERARPHPRHAPPAPAAPGRSRASAFEELFRKRDSSSKPGTPSTSTPPPAPAEPPTASTGSALATRAAAGSSSSCSLDVKVVWFNFAAPPRTPITRRIDYTRLDWNLVSTASPAISAWLNPANRLAIRGVALYRAHYRRATATAACLMAGALEGPPPAAPRSRYALRTAMARQLRDEPSLQLCAALLRHALAADAAALQADLADRHLPSLSTLRQGVIVLSRQWKSVLYSPLLLEQGYRSKVLKPLNVTFALPDLREAESGAGSAVEAAGWGEAESGADESCLLLRDPNDPIDPNDLNDPAHHAAAAPANAAGPDTRGPLASDGRGRGSLTLPVAGVEGGGDGDLGGSSTSLASPAASGSSERLRRAAAQRTRDDLYQWMAKQEPVAPMEAAPRPVIVAPRVDPLAAAAALPACSLYPLQGSLMLLDAHLVFAPLLAALGVAAGALAPGAGAADADRPAPPALESLGSRLSLVAWVDAVRVDIVVGELAAPRPTAGGGGALALACERVALEVELRRVADVAVDELVQRRNVLYISRNQLKKHISTVLNFTLSVRFISQQVNMPLLRLLHQISNMYQNVKDTQVELRSQTDLRAANRHTSSEVSDFRENLMSVSSLERDTQYSTLDSKTWEGLGDVVGRGGGGAVPATPPAAPPPHRARPQSFAQKLRSTGKSVKGKLGYSSLTEAAHTPQPSAGAPPPRPPPPTAVPGAGPAPDSLAPRCWRTLYSLLELYADMPDADTITHRFSVTTELAGAARPASRSSAPAPPTAGTVVVGVARIHRTRLLASLSGLKLEAELTSLQAALSASRARPCSLSGTLGRSTIVLLEGAAPLHQTVVRVAVGKSQALHSWEAGRAGAALQLAVGGVRVELPQHPVALHGVMTRSSRQLSTTLQELGVTRTAGRPRASAAPPPSPPPAPRPPRPPRRPPPPPWLVSFSVGVASVAVTAALLPSLQAQYRMERVSAAGETGARPHFTVELPQHSLSFATRLPLGEESDANVPAGASVALPPVHVAGRVLEGGRGEGAVDGAVLRAGRYLAATADIGLFEHTLSTDLLNHLVFVQKVFMKEVNEVVQKVYGGEKPVPLWSDDDTSPAAARALFSLLIRIKRIQLTALTAGGAAVRLETGALELELSNRVANVPHRPHRAHRLFARATVDLNLSLGQLLRNAMFEEAEPEFLQYAFFKTRIVMRNAFQEEMMAGGETGEGGGEGGEEEDQEVVLIQLRRPLVYVQPVAVDRAVLFWLNYKNAYEYWNEKRLDLNAEVLAATQQIFEKVQLSSQLGAPHPSTLFLQLNVDDIGICLPLNQPPTMGKEAMGSGGLGAGAGAGGGLEGEGRGAVVVTLESTSVVAWSRGALVSKGRFVGLCVRFARDFEASLDDWQPQPRQDHHRNLCAVSEGTYEVCSRTEAPKHNENAKWFLNVSWQMEGVDIHLDVSVGKQLSALGHTLTMITGFEEEDPLKMDYDSDLDDEADNSKDSQESIVMRRRGFGMSTGGAVESWPGAGVGVGVVGDVRARSRALERELREQARVVGDLRALGASHATVELELKRLRDLEALLFKDFRRDWLQKLRRQSVKAQTFTKGKLGLGSSRAHSLVAPDPLPPPSPAPPAAPPPPASAPYSFAPFTPYPGTLSAPTTPRDIDNLSETLGQGDSGEALLLGEEERLADIIEGACWSASARDHPHTGVSRSWSARSGGRGPVQRQVSLPARSDRWPHNGSGGGGGSHDTSSPPAAAKHHHDVDLDDDDEPVVLRRNHQHIGIGGPSITGEGGSGNTSGGGTNFSKGKGGGGGEPNVDFELDVRVHINSGHCVLHTKDPPREDDQRGGGGRMRVGRSASGGGMEGGAGGGAGGGGGSPGARRKPAALAAAAARHNPALDVTVFRVPGLQLKVHYSSRTLVEEAMRKMGTGPAGPTAGLGLGMGPAGGKKAALFAWITLQSIPEETVISPHILEFLERALEPIPIKPMPPPPPQHKQHIDQEGGAEEGVSSGSEGAGAASYGQYVYASFPVDVVVHFHMRPSTFRFSCLPASRVECLLQLPSLQLVFSSKRADADDDGDEAGQGAAPALAVGGLSVTGCLADFSVNMFHPYGGKKASVKEGVSATGPPGAAGAGGVGSPLADSERKDSLSINVEFVKFHLSRSRKLDFQPRTDRSKATVRFSTIVDVGSAWFKYDMRRLSEILAFPKAWYRRTIVRRMFLGDLSAGHPDSGPNPAPTANGTKTHPHAYGSPNTNAPPPSVSPMMPQREKSKTDTQRSKESGSNVAGGGLGSAWETLVLFAVQFTRLNVHMNMGNVMGNVSWQSRDFFSSGRLSIGSSGHRNMLVDVALAGSALDARGGIVGGAISLADIHTYVHISEEGGGGAGGASGAAPQHVAGARVAALELRLEYMGSPALLARVSRLRCSATDRWRQPLVLAHTTILWHQLQVVMSRSTTPDLAKMQLKLEEFFSQQFKSSRRVFSALEPGVRHRHQHNHTHAHNRQQPKSNTNTNDSSGGSGGGGGMALRHHRHWPNVLKLLRPPLDGVVVGGTMELQGGHVSLACFHGNSFKAKSWALFSLKDPCCSFATEAQLLPAEDGTWNTVVVQSLRAGLGGEGGGGGGEGGSGGGGGGGGHRSMATVCRMTRALLFPPQFRTLNEWFAYAFASSDIDAIESFPSLEREGAAVADKERPDRPSHLGGGASPLAGGADRKPAASGGGGGGSNKHSHSREVIFALPSLQLHLRTTHRQKEHPPTQQDPKPVVECSFITEFEDHIFVSVDAEAFLFLHDLISSYIKESERLSTGRGPWPETASPAGAAAAGSASSTSTSNGIGSGTALAGADYREYLCLAWHLEPTVRLLSWGGKSIEPYGVDYILQQLGFRHARTTIPKWVQRGAADPLDALLAAALARLLAAHRERDRERYTADKRNK